MPKLAGVDVLVRVTDDLGEPVIIGGQSSASLELSVESISTTDKTSDNWTTSIPGVRSFSVSCEGFYITDDTALALLQQKFLDREQLEIDIRLPNQTFTAPVYLVNFPLEFSQDSAVTFSLEFVGAGPLTVAPTEAPPA